MIMEEWEVIMEDIWFPPIYTSSIKIPKEKKKLKQAIQYFQDYRKFVKTPCSKSTQKKTSNTDRPPNGP